MTVSSSISRFTEYFRRHGLAATLRRAGVAVKRGMFASRMVVFYCDLDERKLPPVKVPATFNIFRITMMAELSPQRFEKITSFWNPKLASRNIRERFDRGAVLWLVECDGQLAGYGWTLKGSSIEPYYFPLGQGDVQLFDFYVSPKFRGRALHWLLTGHILHALAAEGSDRAFADTHEWNTAQLASFKMTPLRRLGTVRTCGFLRRQLSWWDPYPNRDSAQATRVAVGRDATLSTLSSNE